MAQSKQQRVKMALDNLASLQGTSQQHKKFTNIWRSYKIMGVELTSDTPEWAAITALIAGYLERNLRAAQAEFDAACAEIPDDRIEQGN